MVPRSSQASQTSAQPPEAVMQQAAEWFALLRSGEASEADRLQWQQWCNGSPAHQQAWRYVDALSAHLAPLQHLAAPRELGERLLAANQRVGRRRALLGVAAVLGTGVLSGAIWQRHRLTQTVVAWSADYSTGTGEIRQIRLPDQAQLWLNTASAVNVDYSPALRRLELVRGEVLIRTAPDSAQRPFVVDTRHGRMQALGTRFFVELQDDVTQLVVYEGAVGVQVGAWQSGRSVAAEATDTARFTQVIRAGEFASFDQHGIRQTGLVEHSERHEPSWPSGVLQVADMRVTDVVQQLQPYWQGHIGVADEVAELRVFGSFPLDDIPRSLAVLENAVPVRIARTLPWWIRVQGR